MNDSRRHRLLILLTFVAFISLGLPDGVLGVAWPFMRGDFHLPHSRLGWFLSFGVAGYLTSSIGAAWLMRRLDIGKILLISTAMVAISLAGYALVPHWTLILPLALCIGLGSGAIDAALNVFAAEHFSTRIVTWMHAFYGVGATIGPMAMTVAVTTIAFTSPPGWRWGYASLAMIQAVTAAAFVMTLPMWRQEPARAAAGSAGVPARPSAEPTKNADEDVRAPGNADEDVRAPRHADEDVRAPGHADGDVRAPRADGDVGVPGLAGPREALRHPIVRLHILIYFIYAGIEVTAGQWLFSLLLESRSISPQLCGIAVTVYWASLTAGRIIFGQAAASFSAGSIVRLATLLAPVAAGLLCIRAGGAAMAFAAAALLGFSLAPIYPMLISLTPTRVGKRFATQAVGFQVSAATVGIAVLPSIAGGLVGGVGMEVVPWFLLAASGLLWGINAWTERVGRALPAG